MSGLGKALELGIAHAATYYRKQWLGALARQYPRMAYVDGAMRYVSSAPIDFLGVCKGGRALAIEAKEIEDLSLELGERGLDDGQIAACRNLATLGANVRVIVDVKCEREVYDLPWEPIAEFLARPWRRSLSLQWMRAFGYLVPEEHRDDETKRRVLFLDGRPHSGFEAAFLAVAAEKAKSAVIDLADKAEVKPRPRAQASAFRDLMARKPPSDADEETRRKWLDEFTARQLEEQHKRAKQLRGRKTFGGRR